VTSEGRTLAGISGNPGTGSQTFAYDGLRRVTSATLGGTTTTYGYDGDGNRTTVVVGATTTTYAYDTTDELVSVTGGISGSFTFDAYGNMTANAETSTAGATTYAYDTADRLLTIGPPGTIAKTAGFTYDALGRPSTRTVATTPQATVDTYSYAGTGKTVSRISTKVGNGTAVPLDGLLGADGSRLATNQNTGASFGWTLPDLHGNVAAVASSSLGTITDAIRYDAFGQVAASVTSSLPTPWRYQGRLLVDPTGATDLYDANARFYSPGLATFTQEDTVTGSAQDPLSTNRFLYAEGNPTSLVDPSGHFASTTRLFDEAMPGTRTVADVLASQDTRREGEFLWRQKHPHKATHRPVDVVPPAETHETGWQTPLNVGAKTTATGGDQWSVKWTPGGPVLVHEWIEVSVSVTTSVSNTSVSVSVNSHDLSINVGGRELLNVDPSSGALSLDAHGGQFETSSGELLSPGRRGEAAYYQGTVTPAFQTGFAAPGLIPGADWAAGYDTETRVLTREASDSITTSVRVHITATPLVLATPLLLNPEAWPAFGPVLAPAFRLAPA
jgi:RHS repeat-associated protein